MAVTCDDPNAQEDLCGEKKDFVKIWGKGFIKFEDDTGFYNYIEGNDRVFQVSSEVLENVCPDSHIQLKFMTIINRPDTLERKMKLRLKYRYGLFGVYGNTIYTNSIDEYTSSYDLKGEGEFGIKNAYDKEPGAFYIALEWILENYQDEQVDYNYMIQFVKSGGMEAHYKEYKAPE